MDAFRNETPHPVDDAARAAAEGIDGPSPVAARMAGVMAARAFGAGACTEADLRAAGFTDAEIARHADEARGIARGRAVREGRKARPFEPPTLAPERHLLVSVTSDQLAAIDAMLTAGAACARMTRPRKADRDALGESVVAARAAYAAMIAGQLS
jgi:hypothetical protein